MIEYVVVYPYAVETETKRLPLVLKKRPEHLEGMLNLPGGKLNPGETPIEAGVRELLEETGLEQVQDYDPMCYCPPDYLGYIQGNKSIIHCVRVPICGRQELKPGPNEDEEIKWYAMPDLLKLKNLMPNLRLTIPLMDRGTKDWVIQDLDGNWRKKAYHTVILTFKGMNNPISVNVHSVGHYDMVEEEE